MARDFNGSTQYGQSAINLSAHSKLTVSMWLWIDARSAGSFDMYMEFGPGDQSAGTFGIYDESAGGVDKLNIYHVGTNGSSFAKYPFLTLSQWNHLLFTGDFTLSTDEVNLYLNGALQTPSSRPANINNTSGSTYANTTLNFMSRNAASLHGDGKQAEVGIWGGVVLNANEAMALYRGARARDVRPGSLTHHWPMWGNSSPEPFMVQGGTNLTLTGSPSKANHPPVSMFSRMVQQFQDEAAAPSGGESRYLTLLGVG